jgi:predicted DNA-binding transcriptional regulator AlpA
MKSNLPSINELVQDVKSANSAKQETRNWEEVKQRHDLEACQLIRISELSKLTTLSKSSINLWVAQGKFIPPIVLSPTVKVWKLQNVIDWIDAKHSTSLKTVIHRVHGDIS